METVSVNLFPSTGLFKRLLVVIYDGFLLAGTLLFSAFILVLLGVHPEHSWSRMINLIALSLVSLFFYGWVWTHGGQSLGMKAWRVKLVNAEGGAVTWNLALLRFIYAYLQWLLILGIIYTWMQEWYAGVGILSAVVFFGIASSMKHPQKLMLHDWLSRTRLVTLPKEHA